MPASDKFKNPDHRVPENLKTNSGLGNKNPYGGNFLQDILMGPKIEKNPKPVKTSPVLEVKNIFGKRKEGATLYELQRAIKRNYSKVLHMSNKEGVVVGEEFSTRRIKEKDIDKYLETLPYEISSAPVRKDKLNPSIKNKSNLIHEREILKLIKEDKN